MSRERLIKKSVIYEIGQEMGNISWQFFFANGEAMAAASMSGLAAAAARGIGGGEGWTSEETSRSCVYTKASSSAF